MSVTEAIQHRQRPEPAAVLTMVRPLTWFPPIWAFLCGVVASGGAVWPAAWAIVLGLVLCGPLVCGMSQAANDWCDRHVDAINEPDRPIPSGRIPGRWGLWIALIMSVAAILVAWPLGAWGFGATCLGVAAAWAYSAEPVRLKRSGWAGPGLVGLCYEGLPWFTGAAIVAGGAPAAPVVALAVLYSIGAHGIMTLNDFKAVRGDTETGVRSLPVVLGPDRAARLACWIMAVPQIVVVGLLLVWGQMAFALVVGALIGAQAWAMWRLLADPLGRAPWYNATGTLFYIIGMMVAATALRVGGVA